MNILIFSECYYPNKVGGAEVSTQLLAESLTAFGHNVTVCTLCDKDYEDVVNGVNVIYWKIRNIYWTYKKKDPNVFEKLVWHILDVNNVLYKFKLKKIFKEISPDVIHTNNLCGFSCQVWSVANKMHIPIIHTPRDYYLICAKRSMFKKSECLKQCKACKIFSYWNWRLSKKVDGVVGISSFILNKHLALGYFPNAKVKAIIYNSVVCENDIKYNRAKTFSIGYIGAISEEKGVSMLVKAFSKIKDERYSLLLAGRVDGQYKEEIETIASNCSIRFLGFLRPDDFYKQIDLLVVPSQWQEPFGRVVVEAICNGVPVIASNKGGIPEILKGRREGVVFTDEDSLCELLAKYMNGTLSFDFSNVSMFKEMYSANYIAKQYEEIYERIVKSYHF